MLPFPKSFLICTSGSILKETPLCERKADSKCFRNQNTTFVFAACPKRLLTRAERPPSVLASQYDT